MEAGATTPAGNSAARKTLGTKGVKETKRTANHAKNAKNERRESPPGLNYKSSHK